MLFSPHHISFASVDPLGDGLGDDIAEQRRNPEVAMDLSDQIDADELSNRWGTLLDEARQDPEWFDFAN